MPAFLFPPPQIWGAQGGLILWPVMWFSIDFVAFNPKTFSTITDLDIKGTKISSSFLDNKHPYECVPTENMQTGNPSAILLQHFWYNIVIEGHFGMLIALIYFPDENVAD